MIEAFDSDPMENAYLWSAYYAECVRWGVDPFEMSGLEPPEKSELYDWDDEIEMEGEFA
jgi:hypothetical protein